MTNSIPQPSRFFILRLLHNFSIRNKLLSVMMITSSVAMILTGVTFTLYQSLYFNSRLLQDLSSQAEVISQNSMGALAFLDAVDGRDTLQSLKTVDSMLSATLFDAQGQVLASWQRDGSNIAPPLPQWQGVRKQRSHILVAKPIHKEGQFLGTLLLHSSSSQMTTFLTNSLLVMALLFLLSTAITLALSHYLQGVISAPINYLARIMEEVASVQKYSLRSELQSDDELGALSSYFNSMLSTIEHRDTQLQESQELLQAIINNTSSVIYLKDMEGRYLLVNRRYREVVLTQTKEILGATDTELFPPDLAEQFSRFDARVLEAGRLLEQEEQVPHEDGIHTYISAKFPLRRPTGEIYALAGISTDITERKNAEIELRQLRNYLDNVIDSMPSALIGVDAQGKITRWNHEAELLSGLTEPEATGYMLDTVLPEFKEQLQKVQRAISHRKVQTADRICYLKEGGHLHKEITVYPLVANRIEGAVLRVDDITERVQIEEMMIQTEKMMSVGGLAAGMAHEINNPLGIMIQAVQNIERRVSPQLKANLKVAEECHTSVDTIHSYLEKRMILTLIEDIRVAGARAAKIVSNMLQFSRRSESARQSVDLPELIDQTLELAANDYDLKKKYDFRHIEIIKEYQENLPPIQLMETEIEQVFLNLLKNAAQAIAEQETREGSPQITIRLSTRDNSVIIVIADNGPGISAKDRNRVFEPFFTTKPVGSGTGLGLSVSYMIVTNNHRGKMEVESLQPHGALFRITLPLTMDADTRKQRTV